MLLAGSQLGLGASSLASCTLVGNNVQYLPSVELMPSGEAVARATEAPSVMPNVRVKPDTTE